MKRTIVGIGFFLMVMCLGAEEPNPGLRTILNNWGERNYVAGSVAVADISLIVQAGLRAPSASNKQPWHFTVVQNQALTKKIIRGVTDGNVLVVISTEGDGKNPRTVLDCALAAENIYLAAQALGYGSRIYTGPVDALNRDMKGDLGLPKGHSAVIVVRIGKINPRADAVSRASPRKDAKDLVSYK